MYIVKAEANQVEKIVDMSVRVCPPRKNRQKTYAKNRMKRMTNII